MKKTIRGIIIFLSLVSCRNSDIDQKLIASADQYYQFVELIKENKIKVDRELSIDTASPYHKNGESYWNEYFFTNTILLHIPELKSLGKLWEENMLDQKPRFRIIKLRTNGIIIFTIKTEDYLILGTKYHYLIYNPTQKPSSYYPDNTRSRIIKTIEISKYWSYVVENVYFDFD
jgi:hypothetical protein